PGWDTPTTVLGETRGPERVFPAATGLSLAVITLAYLLPIGAVLGTGGDWSSWRAGALPSIASAVGGPLLGHLVGVGAVTSTAGLFLSLLLTNSRLPWVLARDGMLAAAFGAVHRRFGTPWVAVIVSAALCSVFAALSFRALVIINMWLYSLSLLVELAAFLRLRQLEPRLSRPYRMPGGRAGALAATLPPAACALLAMTTAGRLNTVVGLLAALSGRSRGRRSQVLVDDRRQAVERTERVDVGLPIDRDAVLPAARRGRGVDVDADVRPRPAAAARAAFPHRDAALEPARDDERAERGDEAGGVQALRPPAPGEGQPHHARLLRADRDDEQAVRHGDRRAAFAPGGRR